MSWKKRTESLRPVVLWECKDIPPDLVLSIIQHESGGIVGRSGSGRTKCGNITDMNGDTHEICHAMGLMQVIPAVVNWYNETATGAEFATLEDLIGTDERAARIQIRIGCKYLASVNHLLHRRFPEACPAASLSEADSSQVGIVLTAYAVGPGRTIKKLESLKQRGFKPTFANLESHFPRWGKNAAGKWINRPIQYAALVLKNYESNRGGSFDESIPGSLVKRVTGNVSKSQGTLAVILLLAGAGWLINRHFTRPWVHQ